jgi:hypothetical protein
MPNQQDILNTLLFHDMVVLEHSIRIVNQAFISGHGRTYSLIVLK